MAHSAPAQQPRPARDTTGRAQQTPGLRPLPLPRSGSLGRVASLGPGPSGAIRNTAPAIRALRLLLALLAITRCGASAAGTSWCALPAHARAVRLLLRLPAPHHLPVVDLGGLTQIFAEIVAPTSPGLCRLAAAVCCDHSTNAMMRRLGRHWQRLHRLVYLIALPRRAALPVAGRAEDRRARAVRLPRDLCRAMLARVPWRRLAARTVRRPAPCSEAVAAAADSNSARTAGVAPQRTGDWPQRGRASPSPCKLHQQQQRNPVPISAAAPISHRSVARGGYRGGLGRIGTSTAAHGLGDRRWLARYLSVITLAPRTGMPGASTGSDCGRKGLVAGMQHRILHLHAVDGRCYWRSRDRAGKRPSPEFSIMAWATSPVRPAPDAAAAVQARAEIAVPDTLRSTARGGILRPGHPPGWGWWCARRRHRPLR